MEAACLQPIDVIKTRLQLDKAGKYHGEGVLDESESSCVCAGFGRGEERRQRAQVALGRARRRRLCARARTHSHTRDATIIINYKQKNTKKASTTAGSRSCTRRARARCGRA